MDTGLEWYNAVILICGALLLWWQVVRAGTETVGRLWIVALGFTLLAMAGLLDALDDFGIRIAIGESANETQHDVLEKLVGLTGGRILVVAGVLLWIADQRRRFQRTNDALVREKEVAEEASRTKSRFLAAMSHELRTPLNAIIGFTELLAADETNPKKRRQLDTIAEAGNCLLGMINDLLDLSKIETGQVKPTRHVFVLQDELTYLSGLFAAQAEQKGLALETAIGDGVPPVLAGDNTMLRQILVNLVGNALKFTERGSVLVDVAARREAGAGTGAGSGRVTLLVRVTDTGCGIDPADFERIFEMYGQAGSRVRRRGEGTGLGLAIARRLVEVLGGEIFVESEVGVGSRFSIAVPFDDAGLGQTASGPAADRNRQEGRTDGSLVPVLVVDNDRFSRDLMRAILSRAGYRPTAVPDAERALAVLQSEDVRLVIMDIQLPGQGGTDLAARIRSGKVPNCDPQVPILIMTAYAHGTVGGAGTGTGQAPVSDGAILKPINAREIIARIDCLIGTGRAP